LKLEKSVKFKFYYKLENKKNLSKNEIKIYAFSTQLLKYLNELKNFPTPT